MNNILKSQITTGKEIRIVQDDDVHPLCPKQAIIQHMYSCVCLFSGSWAYLCNLIVSETQEAEAQQFHVQRVQDHLSSQSKSRLWGSEFWLLPLYGKHFILWIIFSVSYNFNIFLSNG